MPARRHLLLRILIGLALFMVGCPPPLPPRQVLEGIETAAQIGFTFLGEIFFLAPGSTGAFLLQVHDPDTEEPIANARVTVTLGTPDSGAPARVFSGNTDSRGVVEVSFPVPATEQETKQTLTVEARAAGRTLTYQEEVYLGRVYNVLVSSDKPVYQPGQVIHMRGLALDTLALTPATDEPLVLTVADPDGNKIFRREITTSRYGVAAADFTLDTQAPSGDYLITAEMGPVASTRTVEVKPYTLPRFKVTFSADQPFYLPGDTATGVVEASYFFGQPVTGGQVSIKGFVTDVDRFEVFELDGVTDSDGLYRYEFQVPDYFVGRLENNTASVDLEISVTDTAAHVEQIDDSVTVAEKPILVEGVPESGFLRPSVENIVYLNTSYPDGRNAAATLEVASTELAEPLNVQTDEFGLATFSYTPTASVDTTFVITATDDTGLTTTQELVFGATGGGSAVLLRPNQAEYRIGDTMELDIYVAGLVSTVYLDVVKGRQTFGLVALPVKQGIAQAAIDVDGSLLGTLELNAYVVTPDGEIVRDRRLALVNPAPAEVSVEADAVQYRPGDTATLDISVRRDGAPMPGVLGVSIVDESVFSVQEQDPGFARTYFLLERELLEPRYEIHGFSDLDEDQYSPYDDNPDSMRTVYRPGAPAAPLARQTALAGFFAEELAAMQRAAAASPVTPPVDPFSAFALGWGYRVALALPLVGLAFYDGTRRRRRWLIVAALLGLLTFTITACSVGAPAAVPAAAPAESADETTATRGTSTAPRLRQFFPETLYWEAALETDTQGHARLEVPVADSITTWRISVLASDEQGNLGSAEAPLRVFQEFFVEPDLPRFLTVGDELDVPVSVYNYLDQEQEIEVALDTAPWFELRGASTQTLALGPHAVGVVYLPLRVLEFGTQPFQITARAGRIGDAVLRQVEVLPNGRAMVEAQNGRLAPQQTLTVDVPARAITGTGQVTVKLYPGIVSQMIAGLERLLQSPYGCFEQTSSTTYPNVLVLDYLRSTGQSNPDLELTAEAYINAGYQRLLTFEVPGAPGGFSLFGSPPAETMLTAYGLMEMADMARVSYVDPAVLERMAIFLMDRQNGDGSWQPQSMVESGLEAAGENAIAATAYVAWALADAGHAKSEAVGRAISYLEANVTFNQIDSYILALVANAYVAAGAPAQQALDQLAAQAETGPDDTALWRTDFSTWLHSYGTVADLETTALAAHALLRGGAHLDVAGSAVDLIGRQRDAFGGYGTTQATILSLKALLLAAQQSGEGGSATVVISLDGARTRTVEIDEDNAGVVQQVTFDDLTPGSHTVAIELQGERAVQYQVVTGYYLPWPSSQTQPEVNRTLRLDVAYDRTELQVNDTVGVTATVELLAPGTAGTVLVDIGIPPGFTPLTGDLDALVEQGLIDRYELTGRQIIFYLTDVASGQSYVLRYRLQARFPIRGQSMPSTAYDYYTPSTGDDSPPQRITVTLGTPGS